MDSAYRSVDRPNVVKRSSSSLMSRQRILILAGLTLVLLLLASAGRYASSSVSSLGLGSGALQDIAALKGGAGSAGTAECARKIRILHLIDRPTMESTMDRWVNCRQSGGSHFHLKSSQGRAVPFPPSTN